MEIKELTGRKSWPFRYTAPWISVLSSIFVLLEARKGDRGRAQRAQNAMTGIPNLIAWKKTKNKSLQLLSFWSSISPWLHQVMFKATNGNQQVNYQMVGHFGWFWMYARCYSVVLELFKGQALYQVRSGACSFRIWSEMIAFPRLSETWWVLIILKFK